MKRFPSLIAGLILAPCAMADYCGIIPAGATDQTVYIRILDATTGVPNASRAYNDSGIDLEYVRSGAAAVDITEATQTASGAHSDGGFVSVGHGNYRLDLPDAAVASGVRQVQIQGTITGYIVVACAVDLTPSVNVATITDGAIAAADFAAGAIDASAIAADAIGASEIATDAIGAAEIAASAIGASEIADGGITSTEFGTGAITATVIAADAIGASEVADGAIDAGALATDTITAAKIAADAIGSSEIAANAIAEDAFDTTAGSFKPLGIIDQGTAQAATATTVQLRSAAAFGDDTILGATIVACGSTQGYCQAGVITDYVGSTDTATVATWGVTPSGTITYYVFGTAPASGSGGSLTAADVWAYATRTLTALDEDSTTIDLNASYVGGVTVFDEDLTTIDINATTLGTVTTATTATNLTNLPTIPANWLTAAGTAADFTTEIAAGLPTVAGIADGVWDELIAGHAVSGSTGEALSAAGAAGDPWITALPGAYTAGQAGYIIGTNLNATVSSRASQTSVDTVDDYVDTEIATITTRIGTPTDLGGGASVAANLSDIEAQTDDIGAAGAGLTAADDAVMTRLGAPAGASVSADVAAVKADTAAVLDDTGTSGVVVSASSVRTAVGLAAANLDTQIGDLPTNAELATSQASADDATLAAIAALNNLSAANVRDVVIEDQGSGVTLGCAISVVLAYAAGDLATTGSTSTYEDPSGTETRITGTVASAGNRTASVTCPTY